MEHAHYKQPQLLGPVEIRRLAEELDISPTKKLGQNFVHDPNTVRSIVERAELDPQDHVIEVGPGLGSLTLALVGRVETVSAVEIDHRLAARLPKTIEEFAPDFRDRLNILHCDALTLGSGDLAGDPPTALVANLPYNVSVPVLVHLLGQFPSIRRVLVMVQAEVADRLTATPGSKTYGVPSVKASFYGTVSRAGSIGKNVFWPAPKVNSGLVRIDVFNQTEAPWDISQKSREQVFPLVDAAFAQRRKTLRGALAKHFGSAQRAEDILQAAGIDPQARGETLSTEDFVRLASGAGEV